MGAFLRELILTPQSNQLSYLSVLFRQLIRWDSIQLSSRKEPEEFNHFLGTGHSNGGMNDEVK